ncbi:hypothetical protein KI688_007002 [Linnemannia hyalina]|uniref:Uncharacterized protein n=1 Tax=Linnemannia hyalina TaxID=64524 RepID=A0A9P7XIR2_9FUNG|nr:hypothetical protein KI688_007002 [Linnemannia hyalina]
MREPSGGGFNEQHEILSDGSFISPFDILGASNKKLQDLFSSCMHEPFILKAGRKPLVDEV